MALHVASPLLREERIVNGPARAFVACVVAFLLPTVLVPASAGDRGRSVGNDDWAVCGKWREVPVRDGREHVTDVEVVSPYEAWVVAVQPVEVDRVDLEVREAGGKVGLDFGPGSRNGLRLCRTSSKRRL